MIVLFVNDIEPRFKSPAQLSQNDNFLPTTESEACTIAADKNCRTRGAKASSQPLPLLQDTDNFIFHDSSIKAVGTRVGRLISKARHSRLSVIDSNKVVLRHAAAQHRRRVCHLYSHLLLFAGFPMATKCSTSYISQENLARALGRAADKSNLTHFGSCSVIAAPLPTVVCTSPACTTCALICH